MPPMRTRVAAFGVVIIGLWVVPALAQDAEDAAACRQAFAPGAAYRGCLAYRSQARSDDGFTAAMGRAGLMQLQQRVLDQALRREEQPDFSAYGVPGPGASAPPPSGCVFVGDGLG